MSFKWTDNIDGDLAIFLIILITYFLVYKTPLKSRCYKVVLFNYISILNSINSSVALTLLYDIFKFVKFPIP